MWSITAAEEDYPLLADIIARPDTVMARGLALKHDGTTTVVLVREQGRRWVVKRYNTKNRWHAVRRTIRASRALNCWHAAAWLGAAGIDTPRPVAALEERRCRALRGRSYFVCEFVDGDTLDKVLRRADSPGASGPTPVNATLVAQAVRIIERLRAHGIVHGDLKATNFIVNGDKVFLTDLDAARRAAGRRLATGARRDFGRFLRNFEDDPALLEAFRRQLRA